MGKKIFITESSFIRLFEKEGGLFADEYSDEDNKKWSENNKKKEADKKKKEEENKKKTEKKLKAKEKREKNKKIKLQKLDNAFNTAFGYKKDLFSDEAPSDEERKNAKDFLKKNIKKKE